MVSGLPIDGGLAGYFKNGMSYTAVKPNRPSNADVPRARTGPSRPYVAVNTSANTPPSAMP
jgi:hypothetical protein